MKITDPSITKLEPNEVFVFGSNESGRHGRGAAKTALKFGAVYGQGVGHQGQTYGIPTVNYDISAKLSRDRIQFYVNQFVAYAEEHPELTFLVTRIGTGLAGWTDWDIAPMFLWAVNIINIHLPQEFWDILCAEWDVDPISMGG